MAVLRNKVNKEVLKEKIKQDTTPRTTISFYRYVHIIEPESLRNELYRAWDAMGVLGRIYLALEGINAQFSVPTSNLEIFQRHLSSFQEFKNMPFKIAVEDDGKSFYKLAIRVRDKIVADGLEDNAFDTTDVGSHLTAKQWNEHMQNPNSIIIDMRNHYESEIGRFPSAICPDADTFREELDIVEKQLKGKEKKKLMFYCTGGVRCEKASAYFKHLGFKDVNQLHGGIIDYARQCKAENLASKFIGKNFVFDERVGERITEDIISECHQCGASCDNHTNCANNACHLLFIQCAPCQQKFSGCCTPKCQEINQLPIEQQRAIRKGPAKDNCLSVYKSRLRPNLKEILNGTS